MLLQFKRYIIVNSSIKLAGNMKVVFISISGSNNISLSQWLMEFYLTSRYFYEEKTMLIPKHSLLLGIWQDFLSGSSNSELQCLRTLE